VKVGQKRQEKVHVTQRFIPVIQFYKQINQVKDSARAWKSLARGAPCHTTKVTRALRRKRTAARLIHLPLSRPRRQAWNVVPPDPFPAVSQLLAESSPHCRRGKIQSSLQLSNPARNSAILIAKLPKDLCRGLLVDGDVRKSRFDKNEERS
jgi:hypothetical protein